MKLLVFSDSHGKAREVSRMMKRAAKGGRPDMVLFAGDGVYEALDLRYEDYQVRAVRGNCDLGAPPDVPEEMTFPVQGVMIYLCHGHRLRVKQGLGALQIRAREVGAQLAIFGHTHHQLLEYQEGIYFLNPGALRQGEYALVQVNDQGEINCQLFGQD
ncbi:MAG: YfcE family phosphodiesterase [Clostridiales bacterium]|nr:YfcE family phosphodiesterase [Clostridiales bacterium]